MAMPGEAAQGKGQWSEISDWRLSNQQWKLAKARIGMASPGAARCGVARARADGGLSLVGIF
jgi:hypothetical protein